LLSHRIRGLPAPENRFKRFKKTIEKSEFSLVSGNYETAFAEFNKAFSQWQLMGNAIPSN